jgi:hypothetical protein
MDPSLTRRRLHVLALGGALLLVCAYAGAEARGGVAAVLGFDLLSGERVRVEVDASVGRTDAEQLAQDLSRASVSLGEFQLRQARQALIAMGVEGAETMPDQEIERRIRHAQVQAMRGFYGGDEVPPPPPEGLVEIR